MAEQSVNQIQEFIKQQLESTEILNDFLSKSVALISVVLNTNFVELDFSTQYDYLCILGHFIEKAYRNNENALSLMLKLPTL